MLDLINEAAINYNDFAKKSVPTPVTEQTLLSDPNSVFDSLALVAFVMEIELVISDKLNKVISLTTGEAMDHLNTVGSLAVYLKKVLNDTL